MLVLWLLQSALLMGFEPQGDPVWGERPSQAVFDQAGVFKGLSGEKGKLIKKLDELTKSRGAPFYLVTYQGFDIEPIQEIAEKLRNFWFPGNEEGYVFILDIDTRRFFMASAYTDLEKAEQVDQFNQRWNSAWIHESLVELGEKFAKMNQSDLSQVEILNFIVDHFVIEDHKFHAQKQKAAEKSVARRLFLFRIFPALLVCLLVGSLMKHYYWKRAEIVQRKYEFPEPLVKPRLGAVYSGGMGAERKY